MASAVADRRAAMIAALPNVRCLVIVDLYTGENPAVVGWVHDDGHGPKASREAPFPALVAPLKTCIRFLQTEAE
jgi:hypothetical protein